MRESMLPNRSEKTTKARIIGPTIALAGGRGVPGEAQELRQEPPEAVAPDCVSRVRVPLWARECSGTAGLDRGAARGRERAGSAPGSGPLTATGRVEAPALGD